MPPEVEIKFVLRDLSVLPSKLRQLGFTEETPRTYERNTLYDFPDSRLRSRGELLRIRKYGDYWILTHKAKGTVGKHKSRAETETRVTNGEQLAEIFLALGLEPCFVYEKFRAKWSDGSGEVVIDETPIGNFVEIEGEAEWIDATARKLGVAHEDYIMESYGALFAAWKARTKSPAVSMLFAETA